MSLEFLRKKLYFEGKSIDLLARKYGTPLYVYSYENLKNNFNAYKKALKDIDHLICYSLKTNSNITIAHQLAKLGAGVDTVSGGEIFCALKAGFVSKKIVYAGVGKTDEEIDLALKNNILMFNVESKEELVNINIRAKKYKTKAGISIRVNPDVDPKTHPYISTGLSKNKFGIDINEAFNIYKYALKLKNIKILGVHIHIGSQLLDIKPYEDAVNKIILLVEKLKKQGIILKYFNIGGGLGINYDNKKSQKTPKDLFKNIIPLIKKQNMILVLEPGRSISGNCGILVTKVLYNKTNRKKNFIIVDAGMNDLVRPSIYDAYHEIMPVMQNNKPKLVADIVGPICESTDFFAKDRKIQGVEKGDYLVIRDTGAYGFAMASNYNSRRKPAEIMIKSNKIYIIRERETWKDLLRNEKMIK